VVHPLASDSRELDRISFLIVSLTGWMTPYLLVVNLRTLLLGRRNPREGGIFCQTFGHIQFAEAHTDNDGHKILVPITGKRCNCH
jgi:hypothetical protein